MRCSGWATSPRTIWFADALNVRHRHPQLWAALAEGRGRVWQARKVAQSCAAAGLDLDQARWVDAVTTPYVASLPWGRFESLVEAKIIEADPDAAEERAKAAAMARFVRTGQSSEYGIKTLIARANAGDVIFFQAMVDRIAQILLLQGDTDTADVRRSKAVGILASPLRALALLEWGARQATAASDGHGPDEDDDGDADEQCRRRGSQWQRTTRTTPTLAMARAARTTAVRTRRSSARVMCIRRRTTPTTRPPNSRPAPPAAAPAPAG